MFLIQNNRDHFCRQFSYIVPDFIELLLENLDNLQVINRIFNFCSHSNYRLFEEC